MAATPRPLTHLPEHRMVVRLEVRLGDEDARPEVDKEQERVARHEAVHYRKLCTHERRGTDK